MLHGLLVAPPRTSSQATLNTSGTADNYIIYKFPQGQPLPNGVEQKAFCTLLVRGNPAGDDVYDHGATVPGYTYCTACNGPPQCPPPVPYPSRISNGSGSWSSPRDFLIKRVQEVQSPASELSAGGSRGRNSTRAQGPRLSGSKRGGRHAQVEPSPITPVPPNTRLPPTVDPPAEDVAQLKFNNIAHGSTVIASLHSVGANAKAHGETTAHQQAMALERIRARDLFPSQRPQPAFGYVRLDEFMLPSMLLVPQVLPDGGRGAEYFAGCGVAEGGGHHVDGEAAPVATPLAARIHHPAEMGYTQKMASPALAYSGGRYGPGGGAVATWMQRQHHHSPQRRGLIGKAMAHQYVQRQTRQYDGCGGHSDGYEGGSGSSGMGYDAGVGGMFSIGGNYGAADFHGRGYEYHERVDGSGGGSSIGHGGGSRHSGDAGVDGQRHSYRIHSSQSYGGRGDANRHPSHGTAAYATALNEVNEDEHEDEADGGLRRGKEVTAAAMEVPPGRYAGSMEEQSGPVAGPITWVHVPPRARVTGPRHGPNSWVTCPVCSASHTVTTCCHGCNDPSAMHVKESGSEVTVCCTIHTKYALKMHKAVEMRYTFV